jgi:hypothetical protein
VWIDIFFRDFFKGMVVYGKVTFFNSDWAQNFSGYGKAACTGMQQFALIQLLCKLHPLSTAGGK